ncbi:MAG: hypothetical protein K2K56_01645 [Lachnospiraceae bacterium]|nr:hypothetical protein [Lachnospiraceae bacterium]MDE6625054.1 hypothetical protein [Lachnospiraceae bacterium]
MTTLLTFRDNIKAFCSRYDYVVTPLVKFMAAMMIFLSINGKMGYMEALNNILVVVLLSAICAFLPLELMAGIGGIMLLFHSFKVSLDVAAVGLALVLIFYCGYMRFAPKTGVIVFLVPLFYTGQLLYAMPIVLGFLIGPAAIIPMAFGLILCNYQEQLGQLVNVLAASAEEDEAVQGYQYVLSALISNKMLLLTIIIFACIILITYVLYRASFPYSRIVAFCVGGFTNVVLFLMGSVILLIEVEIPHILVGSVLGIVISIALQFCKGIVDYQGTELLQFEDDEYYYYVKAVPKLSVAESNKNVKRINSKIHN